MAPTGDQVDFKTKFFDIQGDTLKERKKSFYQLLHETSKSISDDELDFKPRNFLEALYKVEALIYFRKTQQLLKILKEGNVVFICKIIKQKWFSVEAFSHIKEETFVNEVLPTVSCSLRMKILKKLFASVQDESCVDKLFDCIFKRYGLFIAAQFVENCSKEKIRNIISNHVVQLSPNQVKLIYNKDPNLVSLYLKEAKKNEIFSKLNYTCVYVYIAQKDPEFFLKLQQDYRFNIKLGRRTSKGVIKVAENEISKDATKYADILNLPVMSRKLKTFDDAFVKILPKKLDKICQIYPSQFKEYLKSYPKKLRWDVFSRAFKTAYSQDVLEHISKLHNGYIDVAASNRPDIKHKFAELKYKQTNSIDFLVGCDPHYAVPVFKEKINLTSSQTERSMLLKQLVCNCLNEEDWELLEQVLNYICTRHRNEGEKTREYIVSNICAHAVDCYKKFNKNHWKYINDLMVLQKVHDDLNYHYSFGLKWKYLEYLYTNNRNEAYELCSVFIKDEIQEFTDWFRWQKLSELYFDILTDFGKILVNVKENYQIKPALLKIINVFNSFYPNSKILAHEMDVFKDAVIVANKDPKTMSDDDLQYIYRVVDYHLHNSQTGFALPEGHQFVVFVQSLLDEVSFCDNSKSWFFSKTCSLLIKIVQKPSRNDIENDLLDMLLKKYMIDRLFYTCYRAGFIQYFLKNEPKVILPYIQKIIDVFKAMENISSDFFADYFIRKYSFLNLDQQIISGFTNALPELETKIKIKVLRRLCKIMPTEDFIRVVQPFVPKESEMKLDLENGEQPELFKLQSEIAKILRKTLEPQKVFNMVMYYSQGDFLQHSLHALYKVIHQIPENEVTSHIKILERRAVSARKHALFLACEILPVQTVEEMYFKWVTVEKNASNLKNWFTSVSKYFVKNPSNHLFDIMISNLDKISEKDSELLKFITEEITIPKKYRPLYIEKVWALLESIQKQDDSLIIRPYQRSLLTKMYNIDIISELNMDFVKDIIRKYYLVSFDFNDELKTLVMNYLTTYAQDKEFYFIFEIIGNYKTKYWNSDENNNIESIFQLFHSVYINLHNTDKSFLLIFKKYWENVFSDSESFKEHFSLKLMKLYKENPNNIQFAENLHILLKELAKSYAIDGFTVLQLVKPSFDQFLCSFHKQNTKFDYLTFALNLVTVEKNTTNLAFGIWLLYRNYSNLTSEIGEKLLKILKAEANPVIQIKLLMLQNRPSLRSWEE